MYEYIFDGIFQKNPEREIPDLLSIITGFLSSHRHHSMMRRDSLCNIGDTQEGVVYQIFDFVIHKSVINPCTWQGRIVPKEDPSTAILRTRPGNPLSAIPVYHQDPA